FLGVMAPINAQRASLLRAVGQARPGRLAGELDRLAVALGLDVAERVGLRIERDVELAFLYPLVEPGSAEDEPAEPVDEAAIRRPGLLPGAERARPSFTIGRPRAGKGCALNVGLQPSGRRPGGRRADRRGYWRRASADRTTRGGRSRQWWRPRPGAAPRTPPD